MEENLVSAAPIPMTAKKAPTVYDLTAATTVVLIDGATISVSLLVKSTKKSTEVYTKGCIHQWFNSGAAAELTLCRWKSESAFESDFLATMKANHAGTYAIITSTSLISPLIGGFEEKSRKVAAVLASGEWVELTFASISGRNNIAPPSAYDVSKAFAFLTTFRLAQIPHLATMLNQAIKPQGQGWDFRVLGFRKLA